jgi:D-3-phosphoglycerate dehydrogenase / 2-oxoglutarate reductase
VLRVKDLAKNTYLIIDFDSTLVSVEGLEVLAELCLEGRTHAAEVLAEITDICNQGMAGKISFEESLQRRLNLFAPDQYNLSALTDVLRARITPSVWEARHWLRDHTEQVYVISGGFTEWIVPVAQDLGLADDHVIANRFVWDNHGDYVGIDETLPAAHSGGKSRALAELNLSGRVVVIGDGYTDYEVRRSGHADTFYLFTENVTRPELVSLADAVAPDFATVTKLLGG